MILSNAIKVTEKFLQDNAPVILTAIGVAGTVSTAYLTGKASFRAAEIIEIRQMAADDKFTVKEKFLLTWREFVPAIGSGATTITCIIAANRISTSRAVAMAAAYSISEKRFSEYKEKVLEKVGAGKEQKIRDEISQDHVNRNPNQGNVVVVGTDILCYDEISGRYFKSTVEEIKKAQNDTNYEILHNSYCSLADFYNKLGLPATPYSEDVGWNSDHLLELEFSTTLDDTGRPCLVIKYDVRPVRNFYNLH